jgi:hypothetical protein
MPKTLVEADFMPAICFGWTQRARDLGLKGSASRARDSEAYMQGAMQALHVVGLLSADRCGQLAFMTVVGRLPDFIGGQAKKYEEQHFPVKPA